jgi:hypothetical protein
VAVPSRFGRLTEAIENQPIAAKVESRKESHMEKDLQSVRHSNGMPKELRESHLTVPQHVRQGKVFRLQNAAAIAPIVSEVMKSRNVEATENLQGRRQAEEHIFVAVMIVRREKKVNGKKELKDR